MRNHNVIILSPVPIDFLLAGMQLSKLFVSYSIILKALRYFDPSAVIKGFYFGEGSLRKFCHLKFYILQLMDERAHCLKIELPSVADSCFVKMV